jgi:hypothetical protein
MGSSVHTCSLTRICITSTGDHITPGRCTPDVDTTDTMSGWWRGFVRSPRAYPLTINALLAGQFVAFASSTGALHHAVPAPLSLPVPVRVRPIDDDDTNQPEIQSRVLHPNAQS